MAFPVVCSVMPHVLAPLLYLTTSYGLVPPLPRLRWVPVSFSLLPSRFDWPWGRFWVERQSRRCGTDVLHIEPGHQPLRPLLAPSLAPVAPAPPCCSSLSCVGRCRRGNCWLPGSRAWQADMKKPRCALWHCQMDGIEGDKGLGEGFGGALQQRCCVASDHTLSPMGIDHSVRLNPLVKV